jgi:flavin-dependent dehydrogenase
MWRVVLRSENGVHECWYTWVVEASGRSSAFARSHAANRLISDRLVGVFGLLRSAEVEDPDLTVSIESVPDGWWYSTRLPGGNRIAIYFTDGDLLKATGARQAVSWLRLLHQTTLLRQVVQTAGYTLHGEISVMLADTSRLERLHGAGWLAIGDAAASRDPLSAIGISEAVRSASDAASALLQAKSSDQDGIKTYAKGVLERHSAYQKLRVRYYQMERRWVRSEFWKRRHEFVPNL